MSRVFNQMEKTFVGTSRSAVPTVDLEETPDYIYLTLMDSHPLTGSRGSASMVLECKLSYDKIPQIF